MNTSYKLKNAIQKELRAIEKAELKLRKKAGQKTNSYKQKIESKIPKGLNSTLQTAFSKAFGIIFTHGIGIIEKGYDKNNISADFDIRNYAVDKKGSRRELRRLKHSAQKSDLLNMSITALEGVGLGALGIGLPDVVIFIAMILKGIYEVSLRYGYDYETEEEKYFILLLMRTALSRGDEWISLNAEADSFISSPRDEEEDTIKTAIENTARAFATDMLVLKFIQGIPVVGVAGGIFNPVYYNKIMNYARLKYHKRYLTDKRHLSEGREQNGTERISDAK